ncbi:MAG: nuclear transport factor 2 family protein [Phycisphaeraceae bacterium]|nr:nuclear transport factor 2 family protein [Phycisphaeraceae bacterium]
MFRHATRVIATVIVLLPGATLAQPTSLRIQLDPLIDLYMSARAMAERPDEPPPVFAPAVAAARSVQDRLGRNTLGWGVIDGALDGSGQAETFRARVAEMPDPVRVFGGQSVSLRTQALAMAGAIQDAQPRFVEDLWPRRQAQLNTSLDAIIQRFGGREQACLSFMLDALGMPDPHVTIPVYLVTSAPWPGAMTFFNDDRQGVCFVATDAATDTRLLETILHEATHALEIADAGSMGVLAQLERRLIAAGIPENNRLVHDLPHTIMFVNAAETVRRTIDPRHIAYGEGDESGALYDRLPLARTAVIPAWIDYLDHTTTKEQMLDRIVAAAVSLHEKNSDPARVGVMDLLSGLARAELAGDGEALSGLFTTDALIMPPGGAPVISGRNAIHTHYTDLFEAAGLTGVRIIPDEIDISGDQAVVVGRTRTEVTPAGAVGPDIHLDRFLLVAQRDADGTWRVHRLMWTPLESSR